MMRVRHLFPWLAASVVIPGISFSAIPSVHPRQIFHVPRVSSGSAAAAYPSVGALLVFHKGDSSAVDNLCTGTLIGCRTFLTAAHCVCPEGATDAATCLANGPLDASSFTVFLQYAGLFSVTRVRVDPDFSAAEKGDVALLTLGDTPTGIGPSLINTVGRPAAGTAAILVGFGTAGGTAIDDSIKRTGKITTTECVGDLPADAQVCWQFTAAGANSCFGDSGGPLFADLGAGPAVVATISGGESDDCSAPDTGFAADVFVARDWIAAATGDDLGKQTCSDVPTVGADGVTVFTQTGQLAPNATDVRFEFTIPRNTTTLRVALNGQRMDEAGNDNDFDLYIKPGTPPSRTDFACSDENPTPFAFCEFVSPMAGSWHILITAASGQGAFQMTATTFGSSNSCVGDCDRDGLVTLNELIGGVNIAPGRADLGTCPAFDGNQDRAGTIDELLTGVALSGCPLAAKRLRP